MKKIIVSLMASIIFLSAFFTGNIYASGYVGGPSLNKFFYLEYDESLGGLTQTAQNNSYRAFETFLENDMNSRSQTHDYWHVFARETYYDNGQVFRALDSHMVIAIPKSHNAKPYRANGYLKFKNPMDNDVPFQYLSHQPSWVNMSASSGLYYPNNANHQCITIISKIGLDRLYDPNDPPAYAIPGYNNPEEMFPIDLDPEGKIPKDPNDPDFPQQPTPPDSNWDLIGWVKYLMDWVVYLVKVLVYFIKTLGNVIGDVFSGTSSLVSAFGEFFSFLPNQIISIITAGVLALIVVGLVRK